MDTKPAWVKKTCERCSKKDLEKCEEVDGKTFCCLVCFGKYKKEGEGKKPKGQPVNICEFC